MLTSAKRLVPLPLLVDATRRVVCDCPLSDKSERQASATACRAPLLRSCTRSSRAAGTSARRPSSGSSRRSAVSFLLGFVRECGWLGRLGEPEAPGAGSGPSMGSEATEADPRPPPASQLLWRSTRTRMRSSYATSSSRSCRASTSSRCVRALASPSRSSFCASLTASVPRRP